MAESVLLHSCFQLLPGKTLFEVRLTRKKLVYQQSFADSCCKPSRLAFFSTNIEDIYGAKVFRKREDDNAYLNIFTCPLKGKERARKRIQFKVSGCEDTEANIQGAELWAKMISWLIQDLDFDVNTIKERNLPAPRKFLVLVNPFSGSGKSLKTFNKKVVPMFKDASIDYTVLVTEYAGHAQKVANDVKVEDWDGVVICSGDGLVHEFINGLMKRSDWKRAIKMPLGVIPTGSGNALCCSSLNESGEPLDLTAAIYAVIRGQIHDLDICTIETPSQKIFSFLSVTWGMISDIDIESEKYRFLGNARFTLGAIVRILNLRTYHGKLSYLPHDKDQASSSVHLPEEDHVQNQNGDDLSDSCSQPSSPSGSFFRNKTVQEEKPVLLTSHDNVGMSNNLTPSINDVSNGVTLHQIPTTLPPLMNKLPSNWRTVEGEFILGSSVLISHLDANCNIAPHAKLSDGTLNIVYIKSGVSKPRLVSIIGELETGAQANSDEFVSIKAQAFRLEPDLSQKGTIAVDGERIPYSAVQGEIHKGLGKIMCSRT